MAIPGQYDLNKSLDKRFTLLDIFFSFLVSLSYANHHQYFNKNSKNRGKKSSNFEITNFENKTLSEATLTTNPI